MKELTNLDVTNNEAYGKMVHLYNRGTGGETIRPQPTIYEDCNL